MDVDARTVGQRLELRNRAIPVTGEELLTHGAVDHPAPLCWQATAFSSSPALLSCMHGLHPEQPGEYDSPTGKKKKKKL